MSPRYIGIDPTQVIWSNLRIMWWERVVRHFATIAFVVALIVFWAIPTSVVGAISNINYLTHIVPFLNFINNMPPVILGVITGLLPSVLMSVLMALVPIVMRCKWKCLSFSLFSSLTDHFGAVMAKWGGAPTMAAVELWTQNAYFGFQVVQVFIVVTLTSAASSVVRSIIDNPQSAALMLAQHLPKASNFYISYIILQGLTFTSGALLQITGLILGKILGMILDNSPRKMYNRWSSLADLGWGTVLPPMSLLAVIAITYACIAPLVLGFATIGLYLFYFAFRYNLLYVSNSQIDTQGQIYPRALQHLTVGCYLSILCLIGLFAIGSGAERIALGPLILMVIFLVFVVLYHVSLNRALEPLIKYIPKNLESEEEALLSQTRTKLSHATTDESNTLVQGSSTRNEPSKDEVDTAEKGLPAPTVLPAVPEKKPNLFAKFFRPDKYTDYATLRRLVYSEAEAPTYPPEVERDAYFHPAIRAQLPLLWIPRDEGGVSKQEVAHSSRVIPITDEDAWLDEKNKLHWNEENGRPPIYEEKIYY